MPRRWFRTLSFLIASAVAAAAQSADPGEPLSPQTTGPGVGTDAPHARRFEVAHLPPAGSIGIRLLAPSGVEGPGAGRKWVFALRPARPVIEEMYLDRETGELETVDGSDPSATKELFPDARETLAPGPYRLECYEGLGGIPLGDPVDGELVWSGDVAGWLKSWNDERGIILDIVARWKGAGDDDDDRALARLNDLRLFSTPRGLPAVFRQEEREAVRGSQAEGEAAKAEPNRSLPVSNPAFDPVEPVDADGDGKPLSDGEQPPANGARPAGGGGPPAAAGERPPDDAAAPPAPGEPPLASPSRPPDAGGAVARSEAMLGFLDQFRRETLASLLLAAEAQAHASALSPSGPAAATEPAGARAWRLLGEACRALTADDKDLKALAESLSIPALWEPPADWPACEHRARKIRLQLEKGS